MSNSEPTETTEEETLIPVSDIKRLLIKSGEILVVRYPHALSQLHLDQLRRALKATLGPRGVECLILPKDMELEAVSNEELKKIAKDIEGVISE